MLRPRQGDFWAQSSLQGHSVGHPHWTAGAGSLVVASCSKDSDAHASTCKSNLLAREQIWGALVWQLCQKLNPVQMGIG